MIARHPARSNTTRSLTLLCLVVATPSMSIAAESILESPRRPIRSTDRRLRMLLDEGVRSSPTLRALVARLHASDVVVYLECDRQPGADGRLTFVSAVGGNRYVVVRMTRFPRVQQIALIGHELQHAVEIANTPAIVDGESLAREYQRIGYLNHWSALPGVNFDTAAAVDAGKQVLKEMLQEDTY